MKKHLILLICRNRILNNLSHYCIAARVTHQVQNASNLLEEDSDSHSEEEKEIYDSESNESDYFSDEEVKLEQGNTIENRCCQP